MCQGVRRWQYWIVVHLFCAAPETVGLGVPMVSRFGGLRLDFPVLLRGILIAERH